MKTILIGNEPGLVGYWNFDNNGKDKIKCETPQIDNAKGRITGISCRREGADGVSGDGELIKVNFKAMVVLNK